MVSVERKLHSALPRASAILVQFESTHTEANLVALGGLVTLYLLCPREGVLSLLCPGVLSRRQGSTLPHTHTHMERNPGRQDFTTNTRTHTPHTGTHAHARTQSLAHTHAHAHTQG